MKLSRTLLPALALLASFDLFGQAKKEKEPADWYQYRGPKRDGHSPDTGLLKQWPSGGPSLAWKTTGMGAGYSSVAISGARVYTMGDIGDSSMLIALNAADGKIVWTAKVGKSGDYGGYPGTRSTPATDGTLVFGLNQHGDLVCVQAATGREVWRTSLKDKFGGRAGGWGYSESPLLDGPVLACTPGGSRGTVLALNKMNGAPVWQSGELKDTAGYASLVPYDFGGVPQYVVYTEATVAGIHSKTGKLVWRTDRKGATAVIPTPVMSKDGVVFVSSGYGIGCNAFQISAGGGRFSVRELYNGKQMTNHHGGLILVDNHVYGLGDDNKLKCIEIKTGKVVWEDRCVGKGSLAFADGHLIARAEGGGGSIALVEASPEGYKEKGRFNQPDRSDKNSWPHPVVFGGKMYIRDQDVLLCFNVK